MGGTTAKASLIENGAISRGREYEVGGSLSAGQPPDPRRRRAARASRRSTSPRSAPAAAASPGSTRPAGCRWGRGAPGADPGPACYGLGGDGADRDRRERRPRLHADRARSPTGSIAVSHRAGRGGGRARSPGRSASTCSRRRRASTRIANARMTRALRSVSSEKGRDPRDFAADRLRRRRARARAALADDLGCLDRARAARGRALQRRRAALRAAGVPRRRSCHLDSRRGRARRASRRSSPRWRAALAPAVGGRGDGRVGAVGRPALPRPELGGGGAARRPARSTAPRSRSCAAGSRTSTSGSTASAASRARRSRSSRGAAGGARPVERRRPASASTAR